MKGGEYEYKELANCRGEVWDRLSKVKRDEYEAIARKMF